jgi:hypothetical protein
MLTVKECRKYIKDKNVSDEKLKEMIDYVYALSIESIKSNYKKQGKSTV